MVLKTRPRTTSKVIVSVTASRSGQRTNWKWCCPFCRSVNFFLKKDIDQKNWIWKIHNIQDTVCGRFTVTVVYIVNIHVHKNIIVIIVSLLKCMDEVQGQSSICILKGIKGWKTRQLKIYDSV